MLTYDGFNVYFDAKGYACIWLDGKNRKVHVLEWEKHNGPKPAGHDIHHKDHDKQNNDISNLELHSIPEHTSETVLHSVIVRKLAKKAGVSPRDVFQETVHAT